MSDLARLLALDDEEHGEANGVTTHATGIDGLVAHTPDPRRQFSSPRQVIAARTDQFGRSGIPLTPNKVVVGTLDQHNMGQGTVELDMQDLTPEIISKGDNSPEGWAKMAQAIETAKQPQHPFVSAFQIAEQQGVDPTGAAMNNALAAQQQRALAVEQALDVLRQHAGPLPLGMPGVSGPVCPTGPIGQPGESSYESLKMPFLGVAEPLPPKTQVIFHFPVGQMSFRYHAAFLDRKCVTLVYDSRYEAGDVFLPAPTPEGAPVRVSIPALQFDALVEIFQVRQTIGCLDLFPLFVFESEEQPAEEDETWRNEE